MKTKNLLFVIISLSVLILQLETLNCLAQPSIQWQKCYGGSRMDAAYKIVQTTDGGYITIGDSRSGDGDVIGHHGGDTVDVWVMKTDASGNIQWNKSYGGSNWDSGQSIFQTADGGYVFCGSSFSNNADVSGHHGPSNTSDCWVVKIDVAGSIQWQKSYGGTGSEMAHSIIQTTDGGYMMVGYTNSNDGDVSGNHGGAPILDFWVVKISSAGNIQWQKCLGGTDIDGSSSGVGFALLGTNFRKMSVCQTNDGSYFLTGSSASNDGDVSGHHGAGGAVQINNVFYGYNTDCWVVKIDVVGNIQWQKSLGGSRIDGGINGFQTADGGYAVGGFTASDDGDVTGHHGVGSVSPIYDYWIVKLASDGALQWQKTLGGTAGDLPWGFSKTTDGGYLMTGFSTSKDGDVAVNHGGPDLWVVKVDSLGNKQWQKSMGGTALDHGSDGFQTPDGGFIILGSVISKNGDISGSHGNKDVWMVKLSPVPGNVISGTVYEDVDHDCVKDSNEVGLAGKIVKAGTYYATTDANGSYSLFVDPGIYNVSHIPGQYYNQPCPAAGGIYSVTISGLNPNSYNNDFGDTLISHCADVKVNLGTGFFRRCFKNNLGIYYINQGAVMATHVTVSVTFDNLIIPLSSSIPWTKLGNQYIFNLDTLQPGQAGAFYITDSVSCAAIIGVQNACVWAAIHTDTTECDTLNNLAHDCHYIIGSCDPNGKEVASQDNVANGYVTQGNITAADALTYMIRFQNVGNDTAFTVVVRDTLSPYLDPASVEPGAASHPYTFRIYGQGIMEWTFNDIHLADSISNESGSHGFLKFSVKQKAGNTLGTVIKNSAGIWFDYNQPVLTDTTVNIIPLITQVNNLTLNISEIIVSPNPSSGKFNIQVQDMKDGKIEICNVLGANVYHSFTQSNNSVVDISSKPDGIYFLTITAEQGLITKKIIIQK